MVVDADDDRLARFRGRYDVRTVQGDGTGRAELRKAGIDTADLLIACSPREEAQSGVRDAGQAPLRGAGRRPHQQPGLPRSLARARDRRRLHGLLRARDRQRDLGDHRHPGRPPDRRVRRRQGPDRRVRRPPAHRERRADRPPVAPRGDTARLQGGRHRPRGPHDRPARRRGDHAGRPGDRDRLTGVGARVERADRQGRARDRRHRDLRRRPDGRDDRTRAARARHPRQAGRAQRERAREVAKALPQIRSSTPARSTRSSSSTSGSAVDAPRCSA